MTSPLLELLIVIAIVVALIWFAAYKIRTAFTQHQAREQARKIRESQEHARPPGPGRHYRESN